MDIISSKTEVRDIHFDLSHLKTDINYRFYACMKEYSVIKHSSESLNKARKKYPLLKLINEQNITHYIENVELPLDAIALTTLTAEKEVDGNIVNEIKLMSVHVPSRGRKAIRKKLIQRRINSVPVEIHPKLKRFGITAEAFKSAIPEDDPDFPEHIDSIQDVFETSVTLLFLHSSLLNLKADDGGTIPAFIIDYCIKDAISKTMDLPLTLLELADDWLMHEYVVDEHGQTMHDHQTGKNLFTAKMDQDILDAIKEPLATAIKTAKNSKILEGQTWTSQYGMTQSSYRAATISKFESSSSVKWVLNNLTPNHGLSIDSNLKYDENRDNKNWKATGIWSMDDKTEKEPLTPNVVNELLNGKIYFVISTYGHVEQDAIRIRLEPGSKSDGDPVEFKAILDGNHRQMLTSGYFKLNGPQTGLEYDVEANIIGNSATAKFCRVTAKDADETIRQVDIEKKDYPTLSVTLKNSWLRHLSAYVQFLDDVNQPFAPPSWNDGLPGFLNQLFQKDDTKKYLSLVPPVDTLCGVPLIAFSHTVTIPVPESAHTIRLMFGGIGNDRYDSDVCPFGIILTTVFELALPVILLAAGGAVTNSKFVNDLLEDKETLYGILAVAGFLTAPEIARESIVNKNPLPILSKIGNVLLPLLLKTGLKYYITEKLAEGTAERCIPIVDIASTIFNGLVTMALVGQTIIECAESPFVFEADISRSIDLKITLKPDNRYHKFPDVATHYTVLVVNDKSKTNGKYEAKLAGITQSEPIHVEFKDIPAGGNLKVYAFFYADNDWQAGQGESNWLEAIGTNGSILEIDDLEIKTNEVPLTVETHYIHKQKIDYKNGNHVWSEAEAPTATWLTPSDPQKTINTLKSITIAQDPSMVGYSWQATGLNIPKDDPTNSSTNASMYTIQNLSILQDPEKQYSAPSVGFSLPSDILYDLTSPNQGEGKNFFVDPTRGDFMGAADPGSGYHLRRLSLKLDGDPPDFKVKSNQSWGRFPTSMDRYVYHHQGYVFGINFDRHKIYVLKLQEKPSSDDDARIATMASGEGFRDGLINGPRALDVALDGHILILENINKRIQAFDIYGNPVRYFKDPKDSENKIPTMSLKDQGKAHYLDMSVEAKGYIYVLSYINDGSEPEDYRVDIYNPDGTPLVQTTRVAAGKIAVSLLRNLFTLNYEEITGKDGRIEPSISQWVPKAPDKVQK